MRSPEYPDLPWVRPRSFSTGRPWDDTPRVIVVHHTAGHEGPDAAENGAAYDQARLDGTSAHFYIDSSSVVQCVLTTDRSHTALWNGNNIGIHYELCGGYQTRQQWLDPISDATITRAAAQMARDAARYNIPIRKLTPDQVAAGERGFCGHADITAAFPADGGSHTDPGPYFPWDVLLARVAGGDDMSDAVYALLDDGIRAQDGKPFPATAPDADGTSRPVARIYHETAVIKEMLEELLARPCGGPSTVDVDAVAAAAAARVVADDRLRVDPADETLVAQAVAAALRA